MNATICTRALWDNNGRKAYTGYYIAVNGNDRPLYVKNIRKGKMALMTDYGQSKIYTLATAKKHANAINSGRVSLA